MFKIYIAGLITLYNALVNGLVLQLKPILALVEVVVPTNQYVSKNETGGTPHTVQMMMKLGKMLRLAFISVTGVLNSCSSKALDVILNFTPLDFTIF